VPPVDQTAIEQVFRHEYGRAVAVLVRVFGDIDLAEESVQDAFTVALQRWPSTGSAVRRPVATGTPRPSSCTAMTSRPGR